MSKKLISIKFGGTSMGGAETILECAKIVKEKTKNYLPIVTVSAVGGVTNELINLVRLAKKQKPRLVHAHVIALKKRHWNILKNIVSSKGLDSVWEQDFLPLFSKLETILIGTSSVGDITQKTESYILSFGEKLSSHLMVQALNKFNIKNSRIDAERVIKTDDHYLEANVKFKATTLACRKIIKPLVIKKIVPIVTGFIGKDTHGNTTLLGRGGSDYTASILAIGVDAEKIEIWTDVNGIMSADPRVIKNAISWPILDMAIVSEMAYSGAKVIHPKSITAAIQKNIPVYIMNTFNPGFQGTKVANQVTLGVKGIISSNNNTLLNVESPNMLEGVGFLAHLTKIIEEYGVPIDVCATSETTFTFSIKNKDFSLKFLKSLKKIAKITIQKNLAKLSIIGNNITNDPQLLADIFVIMAKQLIYIRTVSIGASTNNITLLVDESNSEKAFKTFTPTTNKLLKFMTTSIYTPPENLAKKIAQKFGTPIFITDAKTIIDRIKELRSSFSRKTKIYYAMKANYNPAILKLMLKNGIDGIDATSPFEIKLAKNAGFPSKQIIFTGVNSSIEELRAVYQEKVLPNLGSLSELEKWGEMFPHTKISIRVNPGSGGGEFKELITAGKHAKFGIRLLDLEKAKKIIKLRSLKVIGLHFHLGSGLYNTKRFERAIKSLCQHAPTFEHLRFLDVGGGFGVRYRPEQKPVHTQDFFKVINKHCCKLEQHFGHPLEIRIEPGKFLVAESTCLLTKVNSIKKDGELYTIGVDTSLNHIIRPSLYGAYHHVVKISPQGKPIKANIVGNICESTDVLGVAISLRKSQEGDLIAILTAGAYCASMSSLYNLRPYAAEVLIDKKNCHLIKRKLSFAETIKSQGFSSPNNLEFGCR
jgi:diaminopimelate decarboxylase